MLTVMVLPATICLYDNKLEYCAGISTSNVATVEQSKKVSTLEQSKKVSSIVDTDVMMGEISSIVDTDVMDENQLFDSIDSELGFAISRDWIQLFDSIDSESGFSIDSESGFAKFKKSFLVGELEFEQVP